MINNVSMHIIDAFTLDVYDSIFFGKNETPPIPFPLPNVGDLIMNDDAKVLKVISRTFHISPDRYSVSILVMEVK